VSGDRWLITIESNAPGTGWVASEDQITFPRATGGQVQFDIQSNDPYPDEDFNDLILTCSMPQSASEFAIYGNATCYSGLCLINPCIRRWVVIETAEALLEAAKNPVLRVPIEQLYAERLVAEPPLPIPEPDPPPFVPIVIPVNGETALPPQLVQTLSWAQSPANPAETAGGGDSILKVSGTQSLRRAERLSFEYDRLAVAEILDRLRLRCETEKLAGYVLNFQEYDRTAAELAGAAYSGEGDREDLGLAVTDRNGNYIFRFSRNISELVDEALNDVASGEDAIVQSLPDIIVQLLDRTTSTGIAHQSAPYWNVNQLRRIDICIPCSKVYRPPTHCTGTRTLERIGAIRLGIAANKLDDEGRITATDTSVSDVPQARCAAWFSKLRFFGCLGDRKAGVTQYTLQFRRKLPSGSWTGWSFYQEPLSLFKTAIMDAEQVGPFDRNLEVFGGTRMDAKAYENVEGDRNWAVSEWALKAVVNSRLSSLYDPTPGTFEFRIQGYDASGYQVSGTEDKVKLYIDNQPPELHIASVKMGSQDGGGCVLFHLSGEPNPAPLTVRFKAIQKQGFLNDYELWVRKGNLGKKPTKTTTGPGGETSGKLSNSYAHNSTSTSCNYLVGTRFPDDPVAVGDYVTAYVIPDTGNWLSASEPFCTFAVKLDCWKRMTNGYNNAAYRYGPREYLLGISQ
jgi:hypothetical protein